MFVFMSFFFVKLGQNEFLEIVEKGGMWRSGGLGGDLKLQYCCRESVFLSRLVMV